MAGQDKKGSSKAPVGKEDKSDLNLSTPCFLTPISNSETREIVAFSTPWKMMTVCQSLPNRILVTQTIASISHVEPKHFLLLISSEAVNPNDRRQRTCTQQRLFVSTHHQAKQS